MKRFAVAIGFLLSAAADTPPTVFGLALGAPLSLPACLKDDGPSGSYKVNQPVTCLEAYDRQSPNLYSNNFIIFPPASAPAISGRTMGAFVRDGRLLGIEFDTIGVNDQDEVLAQLTSKFGKPTHLERPSFQTNGGASFQGMQAVWNASATYVRFESGVYRADHGRVTIETIEAKGIEDAAEAQRRGARTPL